MVVKYIQVHGVACLRHVRKTSWMEAMHVQCVTKPSSRKATWKPIGFYILVKILFLVMSASVHSAIEIVYIGIFGITKDMQKVCFHVV
jgi:hypothetical protein